MNYQSAIFVILIVLKVKFCHGYVHVEPLQRFFVHIEKTGNASLESLVYFLNSILVLKVSQINLTWELLIHVLSLTQYAKLRQSSYTSNQRPEVGLSSKVQP
jgi:hypothetical protein